jgi:hypothetical protein
MCCTTIAVYKLKQLQLLHTNQVTNHAYIMEWTEIIINVQDDKLTQMVF